MLFLVGGGYHMAAAPLCRVPLRSLHRDTVDQLKCSNLTSRKNEKVEEDTGVLQASYLNLWNTVFPRLLPSSPSVTSSCYPCLPLYVTFPSVCNRHLCLSFTWKSLKSC